jgi:hypothetical protein
MVTNGKRQAWLTWFLVISVSSCAVTTDFNEGGHPIPDGWSITTPHDPKQCGSIVGTYQILGLGKQKDGDPLVQTRLDVALGYTFPSNEIPNYLSISVEEESNTLNYQFSHPVNRSFTASTICADGWYRAEKQTTNQYVGDGANLDYSNRKIELGITSDGDLIVHLILESQFSAFRVLKSHEKRETWSKYEKIDGEN